MMLKNPNRAIVALSACVLNVTACSKATPPSLQPGRFQSPLVEMQRLQGEVGHLHVDEIRYRASGR